MAPRPTSAALIARYIHLLAVAISSASLATCPAQAEAPVSSDPTEATYGLSRDGFLTSFLALGPIPDSGAAERPWRETLALPHLPIAHDPGPVVAGRVERLDRAGWDDEVGSRDRELRLEWHLLKSAQPEVELTFDGAALDNQVAYLYAELEVMTPFSGWLLIGCDDDLLAWVDGTALEVPAFPGWLTPDQHWVPLALEVGRHTLLLKTYNARGRWVVATRLLTDALVPPEGVRLHLPLDDGVVASDAPLESLVWTLAPSVLPSGEMGLEVILDQPGARAPEGGVLCVSADTRRAGEPLSDPAAHCLPAERVWAGPQTLLVGEVPGGAVDGEAVMLSVTLEGTHHSPSGTTHRVETFDLVAQPEAVRAVARARQTLQRLDDIAPQWLGRGTLDSYRWDTERVSGLIEAGDDDRTFVPAEAAALDALTDDLEAGRDPYEQRSGAFYRAYRSEIDGRLQPYAIYVPARGEGTPALPLVVSLHGLRSHVMMNLRQVLGFDRDREESVEHALRHFPADVGDPSAIFVAPYGFDNTLYRFMGEIDVLRVVEEVEAVYGTDPHRRYLTGLSMGGIGAFDLGLHRPDQFAAVLALAGTSDLRRYSEFRRNPTYEWELALADEYSALAYAENGLNIPIHAVHGTRDGTHYSHSEVLIDRLDALGYDARLETPALRHNVWRETYAQGGLLARLGEYQMPAFPSHVTVRTPNYRYAHHYWLSIVQLDELHQFANASARFRERSGGRRLTLETDGTSAIELRLGDAPQDWQTDPLTVEIDGDRICEIDCWRSLSAARSTDGGWRAAERIPARRWRKGPALSGPIQDAWYGPLLLVYGTQDPSQTEFLRRLAERDANMHERVDIAIPVRADREVTDAEMAVHHLLLYGDATSNSLIARMHRARPTGFEGFAGFPIEIEAGGIRVGDEHLLGDDLSAIFIYPNPLTPTPRYVVVNTGTSAPALDAIRFAPRFLPDFVVFDGGVRVNMTGQRTFRGAPVLAGGFFQNDWSLPPSATWLHPQPR